MAIVISDIHGRSEWKKIIERYPKSKIIFLGDYVDSFDIPPKQQIKNLQEILEFKRKNKNRVVLLFGNHDYHYTSYALKHRIQYSGFKHKYMYQYNHLIQQAYDEGLFQACMIYGKYLLSHAGISKIWCEKFNINMQDLENNINHLFSTNLAPFDFLWGNGFSSSTGDNVWQSPLWIRPNSLYESHVEDYIHIVGHTIVEKTTDIRGKILLTDTEQRNFIKLHKNRYWILDL